MKKIAIILLAGAFAFSSIPTFAQRAPGSGGSSVHSSTGYWIIACPAGVVTAAMVKNWKRHKELNTQEAWTCGLLYWWNEATGQYGRY